MLDCTDLMQTHSLYIEINSHPLSCMILYIKLKSLAILTKRWCCLSCWLAGLEFQAELGGAVGKWAVLHLVFSKWRLVLLGSWIIEYNAAAIAKQAKAKQRRSSQLQSDKSSVSAWHHSPIECPVLSTIIQKFKRFLSGNVHPHTQRAMSPAGMGLRELK